MAHGVQKNVVRFYIAVDNFLAMEVLQGASKFGYPEADDLLRYETLTFQVN